MEAKKKLAEASGRATAGIQDELTCSVCLQLFLEACTLECAHSFCRACIHDWLKRNDECPACREQVKFRRAPVPSIVLDNAVAHFVSLADNEEDIKNRKEMLADLAKRKASEAAKEEKLIKSIESVDSSRFLDIKKKWDAAGKATFQKGAKNCLNKVRMVYGSTVNLDEAFVTAASEAKLARACDNLLIQCKGANGRSVGAEEMRRRVWLFRVFACDMYSTDKAT